MEQKKARLGLIFSMFIFGTIGVFRRYIPLPSGFLAMSRGLIGTIFLAVIVYINKKRFDIAAIKRNLVLLIISGGMIGFNWILLFEAYNYTSVATATLCYYAAPIFVIVASPFFLGERLTLRKTVCVMLSVIGMIGVSGVFDTEFSDIKDLYGVFFGLGAALLYACIIIINKKLNGIGAYDKTTVQLCSAAIVLLPYVIFAERITPSDFNAVSVIMLLVVGVIHTGVAYAMYFGSIPGLKAQTVALFSYIDPVVAIILSALVLREDIGIMGYIGSALVLGATLVSELPEKK